VCILFCAANGVIKDDDNNRCRVSASTVLTGSVQVNGRRQTLTPTKSKTPELIVTKFGKIYKRTPYTTVFLKFSLFTVLFMMMMIVLLLVQQTTLQYSEARRQLI